MDRDEAWFFRQMDQQSNLVACLIGENDDRRWASLGFDFNPALDQVDQIAEFERYFGRTYDRKWAPAFGRSIKPTWKVIHGKPALRRRQRHSCPWRGKYKGESAQIATDFFQRRLARSGRSDQLQQEFDYQAAKYTDLPSVSLTIGNSYFHQDVWEYPLWSAVMTDGQVDDYVPPDWCL